MSVEDFSKGKKYRARQNVSFGHMKDSKGKERAHVMAGEIFHLDDPDLAKELIAKGVITENLAGGKDAEAKPGEATFTDKTMPPANTVKNAAETKGNAADKKDSDD